MEDHKEGVTALAALGLDNPPSAHAFLTNKNSLEGPVNIDDTPSPTPLYEYLVENDVHPIFSEPDEPQTYAQALKSKNAVHWKRAMDLEMGSLDENHTWDLYPIDKIHVHKKEILSGKWVYKIKRDTDNNIERFKARWVVRGFEQIEGLNYNETFASVVKPMSYKALFAIAAARGLHIEQMDVVTAFLYGDIDETIYMHQPTGYTESNSVCKLRKALYGLKQAPRIWFKTLEEALLDFGFKSIPEDAAVFVKGDMTLMVYVDDLLIFGPDMVAIDKVKKQLSDQYKMKNLGHVSFFLGIKVERNLRDRTLKLTQTAYIESFLKNFGMWNASPEKTPMNEKCQLTKAVEGTEATTEFRTMYQSAVGSLIYAMLGTRPDIAYAVASVSRFSSNPTEDHWKAVKRIMRYLRGTLNVGLEYGGRYTEEVLEGFTDADWANDKGDRKSIGGYIYLLNGAAISWSSKKQSTIALSSCEAEYTALCNAAKEAVWLRRLLQHFDVTSASKPTTILADNQSAIALVKNPQFHSRTKHINIQYHYTRDQVERKTLRVDFIPTNDQITDILTKPLGPTKFLHFIGTLGLKGIPDHMMGIGRKRAGQDIDESLGWPAQKRRN
jgi:hypothetical protein